MTESQAPRLDITEATIVSTMPPPLGTMAHRDSWLWASGLLVLTGLGITYAAAIPRNLPYDEPSHWLNVAHIASTWSLPIVGKDGVTYEGQQGPLAYIIDAFVYVAARQVVDPHQAFVVVRASGLIWLGLCAFFAYLLVQRAAYWSDLTFPIVGVAVAFFNPMLVACASSIQNDIPALALALLGLYLAVAGIGGLKSGLGSGVCAGLALITKFTSFPVMIVIAGWLIWHRRYRAALASIAAYVAVGAWWVVRNEYLYGDPTGADSVKRLGIHWEPVGLHGASTLLTLARAMVTFLWLPVEYYRNAIQAPLVLSMLVSSATVAILVSFAVGARSGRLKLEAAPVIVVAGLCIGLWMVVDVLIEGASFRLAYPSLVAWSLATAMMAKLAGRRAAIGGMVLLLVLLHAWVLYAVATNSIPRLGAESASLVSQAAEA